MARSPAFAWGPGPSGRSVKRGRILAGLALVALLAAAALALRSRRVAVPGGPFREAPLILVSIDTLRADRLPAYGYRAGRTPSLDRLAAEGILFEDVYSHCPLTLPAHASLMTGLLPPRHGVRDNTGFTLEATHLSLATRLKGAGFETAGAVSSYVLRRATGIAAGFDFYDDLIETDATKESLGGQQRDGAVAVSALARWIEERRDRRVFAFLHLYEPHAPWTPPERHRQHSHPYDGEVAHADELVGQFLDRLRAAGVLDRAVVAVTSDHGEGLGDHREQEHGLFVYREAVQVPLIVRLPGGRGAGLRVKGVMGQADIPATLLDLLGLSVRDLDGISQRAALGTGTVIARPVYSETLFPRYHFGWSELTAATDDRLRYIQAPRPELFDVKEDPGETRNLVGDRAPVAAAMRAWLETKAGGTAPAPAAVPDDVRERLEALGYVGSAHAPAEDGAPRADPKDEVEAYEAFKQAHALRTAGRDAEAVDALQKLLATRPGMLDARETLGVTLFGLGRVAEAVTTLQAVVAAAPERASAHLALARLFATTGNQRLFATHATLAAQARPGEAYEMLAQSSLDQGRLDEAAAFAARGLAADPDRPVARYIQGLVARRRGKCEEALTALADAEAIRLRHRAFVIPGVHASRGDCLARLERYAEAEAAFQEEVRNIPHSREGRVGLGILYRSQGRDADAREVVAGIVTAHPRAGADEYAEVVRTFAGLEDIAAAREWAARGRSLFPHDKRFR
jgi:choline-sulfatase